ncbi:sensor histidine kinase [Cryptosporangium aurantiacum]|uniref:histidine kinase n=1 Tax=Cryptosporangium aurantiacum TaxID=134849 RepID=A0A1M7QEE9_9ACTN|nr:histidine kinase [Cryptosporangium aurantiacum]SHN29266.1 Signal transduction histidine kinase [Cryptosporangium aurantiacum]
MGSVADKLEADAEPVTDEAMLLTLATDRPEPDSSPRRQRLIDVICVVVSAALPCGFWIALATGHTVVEEPIQWFDLIMATVCAPLVWWRRRWPTTISVVVSVLATVATLASIAQGITLLTVAIHRRPRQVLLASAVFVATGAVYNMVRPSPDVPYWVTFLMVNLLAAGLVAWGSFIKARRALIASLRERARRAEEEQHRRVEQARQLERTRIAREMHDVLAHRISLLSLHAGALEFRPDAPPDEIARAAGVIRASAHEALQDLRDVIGVLRAGGNDTEHDRPQPTLGDVPGLVTEARRAGSTIDLDVQVDDADAVPPVIGRTAYRVVQEGLTNARKHARGAAVRVMVSGNRHEGLTVEVRNWLPLRSAVVTDQIPGTGTGIIGLGERVGLAGGRLEHGPSTAGDFRLKAWLPWES